MSFSQSWNGLRSSPCLRRKDFVITMLAMMALSMGVICVLAWCMRRNVRRRDPMVDALLEEVAEEEEREKRAASHREPLKTEPWERDGDWWKK